MGGRVYTKRVTVKLHSLITQTDHLGRRAATHGLADKYLLLLRQDANRYFIDS